MVSGSQECLTPVAGLLTCIPGPMPHVSGPADPPPKPRTAALVPTRPCSWLRKVCCSSVLSAWALGLPGTELAEGRGWGP
jgi:hypothetical protein